MLPSQFKRYTRDTQPLVVDVEIAEKIGLNESIIIRQLHYWLTINEIKKNNLFDGKVWCYNSIKEWKETNFPFWSAATIKRTFQSLEKLNLINKMKNPKNKWDRTIWYTIDYDKYAKLFDEESIKKPDQNDLVKLHQSIRSNCTNRLGQNDQIYNITENTTENTAERATPPKKIKKSKILEKIENELPKLASTPLLPSIIRTLNQREESEEEILEFIDFVAENKKDKILEIKGWKFWFWDDFLSEKVKKNYEEDLNEPYVRPVEENWRDFFKYKKAVEKSEYPFNLETIRMAEDWHQEPYYLAWEKGEYPRHIEEEIK